MNHIQAKIILAKVRGCYRHAVLGGILLGEAYCCLKVLLALVLLVEYDRAGSNLVLALGAIIYMALGSQDAVIGKLYLQKFIVLITGLFVQI